MTAPIDTKYPPLLLTFAQLRKVLAPITVGYPWGEGTIHDLWKIGAPIPGTKPEKRIVFPSKLLQWLTDVLERQGLPLDANAQIIAAIMAGEDWRSA